MGDVAHLCKSVQDDRRGNRDVIGSGVHQAISILSIGI